MSRSASRRELANTIVERCASIRSTTRSSTCGQMRGAGHLTGGLAGQVAGGAAQRAHVRHRHDDVDVDLLGRRRLDHGHRAAAGEEAGDLLHRPDGRGQPDPLRRPIQQRVQPVERDRQVRTAFGAGDGVHLVDDDGPDAGQHLPGPAGQQQEQRLRGGDQDVRAVPGERPPIAGRGVAGADGDADLGQRRPRAERRPRRCRSAASAGCARRRPRAPSAATGTAPSSARRGSARGSAAARRPGRRSRTGTRRASCRTRSARPPGCARPARSHPRRPPGRPSVRRTRSVNQSRTSGSNRCSAGSAGPRLLDTGHPAIVRVTTDNAPPAARRMTRTRSHEGNRHCE